jgi:hypothetical protein
MILTTSAIISKQLPLLLSLDLPSLKLKLPLTKPILSILALNHALARILNNSIQPRRESESRFRNLLRDNRDSSLIVRAADFLVAHSISAVGNHRAADKRIRVVGPEHSGVDRVFGFEALGPRLGLFLIHAALDLARQIRRPALGVSETVISREFLRNRRIPGGMQIRACAVEGDVNQIAADLEVLDVQRLVDVAGKVDHPLERFLLLGQADGGSDGAGAVIGDGGHDAAFLGTVALVVDVAGGGRGVEGVDVVERRAEGAFGGVAVAVGLGDVSPRLYECGMEVEYPCSNICEVRRRSIVQDTLRELLGVLRNEILRNVRNGRMT